MNSAGHLFLCFRVVCFIFLYFMFSSSKY